MNKQRHTFGNRFILTNEYASHTQLITNFM